jgi:hypothetical protein
VTWTRRSATLEPASRATRLWPRSPGLAQAGDVARAGAVAEEVGRGWPRTKALSAACGAATAAREFAVAERLAVEIPDEDWRSRALSELAVALAAAGQGEAAFQATELMRVHRSMHMATLAAALFEHGDPQLAKRALQGAVMSFDSALQACFVLAGGYPDRAVDVVGELLDLTVPEREPQLQG